AGCQRILTSGQKPGVDEGLTTLINLVQTANDRIIIMPGSGVRSSNILWLLEQSEATEFHTTARTMVNSGMQFINPDMQEQLSSVEVDAEEVQRISQVLKAAGVRHSQENENAE
ncbi:MAG: copper homeostasis protein CutC, partial [Chitinophagaceae bacterium]